MRKLLFLVGLVALAACNTPLEPGQLPLSLGGNWAGSLSSADTSLGTLHLTIVPSKVKTAAPPGGSLGWTVGGTWSISMPNAADSGTMSGGGAFDADTGMHFTLQASSGCTINLNGSEVGGYLLGGSFAASSCALPAGGSFTITKQ